MSAVQTTSSTARRGEGLTPPPSPSPALPNPRGSSATGTVLFRRERAPARAGRRMRTIVIASIAVALPALVIAVASANAHPVEVDCLFGRVSVPLPWLIEITAVLGWLSGALTARLLRRRATFGGAR